MRRRGCFPYVPTAAPRAAAGLLALLLLAAGPARAQNDPAFWGVGDLPGGAFNSVATDVSADGTTVVGSSEAEAGGEAVVEAFRWTSPATMQGLGDLSGGEFYSAADGVSADGSVVVGVSADGDYGRAFRWTSAGGMVGLERKTCLFGCAGSVHALATAVSRDGLVVVGSGANGSALDPEVEAARWPGGNTSIDWLGYLSGGGTASVAYGASASGSVIVGKSDSGSGHRAFAWTPGGGMTALVDVPGALVNAAAMGVSADGTVVVGAVNTSTTTTGFQEPARWTGSGWGTLELLGPLPGASGRGTAQDVSGDGQLVVGTAKDAEGEDVAFLWSPTEGMRALKQVLIDDYGLPVEDWDLAEARGISDVNPAGEFVVVGAGTNPAGDPEGWVAVLSPTACNDGLDNDGDGQVDFPADPGCLRTSDRSEGPDCADGLDNDGDGQVDGADAQCTGPGDASEEPDCADGVDSDGDGLVDFPADPGCRDAGGLVEDPACDDGLDNDGDGATDWPFDLQCVAGDDASEEPGCADGLDNDGDGLVDHPADPDCTGDKDLAEDAACNDRVDNDGDGLTDWPDAFPACRDLADAREEPECSDGVDNDGDGLADGGDPDCVDPRLVREDPADPRPGDLLVLDRTGATLFALDPATGGTRVLTSGQRLTAPQGLGLRATGQVAVADPDALIEVDPVLGRQRVASPPLDSVGSSLQVVFDAAGDAIVLEPDALTTIPWHTAAPGTPSTLVPIPTPDGTLVQLTGYSLVRESDGSLLTTGLGANLAQGIFRVDPGSGTTSVVTPGQLNGYNFKDLALASDGQILAVGRVVGTGTGLFRVDPDTGALSVLSVAPDWVDPMAVAVGSGGAVFVADAGTCDAGGCTGAEVVRVDPSDGTRLEVWSGPLMQGPMDLEVVAVLPACRNGVDEDGDGKVDYPADGHCTGPSHISEEPACSDGLDNDGDGAIDHPADIGCKGPDRKFEDPACSDGVDNDGDGRIDWDGGGLTDPDPQCGDEPGQNREGKAGCGLGFELLGLLPLLRALRRRQREAEPSSGT